ncbi:hypothetical protein FQR65_LT03779 [Abscondita terminalis]|nr:hypothetical protein FQR65_LT03779 [Abscondita terminalis]
MIITALLFFLAPVVALTICWCIVYLKYEKYLCKFRGPSRLPIIGSLHHFGTGKNLLPSVAKLIVQCKEPEKFMFGFYPGIAMGDAKSVEFVLGSKTILKKSLEYKFLDSWLGTGLLTSDGAKWKKHRRLLTPAFHFQILEQFIDVFNNQGNILVKKLEEDKNETINIFPYMTLHALDVICEATMNTPINAQLNPNSSFVRSVKQMCKILIGRTVSVKMFDIIYKFSKDYYKEKAALTILHGLSESVIKTRRAELQAQKVNNFSNENDLGKKKRVAFLDILLTSTVDGVPLTDEEIRNEVDTFMFAGHDTTTSALSFTVYTLSKHPEIQQRVFEELNNVLGNDKTVQFTYDNLQKLKYLEQVIKEVLRFYPPVPYFSRIITEDVTYDGKIIPKGVLLIVFAYLLHHNPEYYDYPEMFDPERFNTENSKNISLYSYVPFSAGSRNCIDLLPSVTRMVTQYKRPERFMLGFYPGLGIGDAKTVEFLLGSKTILKKSLEYKYFDSWLGTGLLTSEGNKWKKHRRLLTPAFHFQILEQFIQVFENQSNILIKKFDDDKNAEINVFPYMTLHALDVICEATMNTPINAQLNPTSDFVKSVKEMCNILINRSLSFKMFNILYRFTEDYHKEKKALSVLHGLNVLLTSTVDGVYLTNEEIRDEVNTFLFAGHDTTTSALSFTVYTLSKYPEIQDKVFQEISDVLGNGEASQFTYENLQKLKYLEQVIKEVLRFYPPVPMFSRIVTEDVTYDGKIIPKGVVLLIFAYHLHHNPEFFDYPEVFDPERFNTENLKNISLYSYVPFSAGSRNCIGQRFAMLEIKTTVSKILQKFKILPVLGHEPVLLANAILTSENGLPVRFENR